MQSYQSQLKGKKVVLATAHRKEVAIADLLSTHLGVQVLVPAQFNSDQFGTFSGEVPRGGSPIDAARKKIASALDLTGCNIGVASEGSFGPHPQVPFLPTNEEWLVWFDRETGLEVMHRELSFSTNHAHVDATSRAKAHDFLQQVGFPEHGIMIRLAAGPWIKGICSQASVDLLIEQELRTAGVVHIETDMRAMFNPTRMAVIRQAALGLVKKLKGGCPRCSWPAMEAIHNKRGLPCAQCGQPTFFIKVLILKCRRCRFEIEQWFPSGIAANPAQCNYCNP